MQIWNSAGKSWLWATKPPLKLENSEIEHWYKNDILVLGDTEIKVKTWNYLINYISPDKTLNQYTQNGLSVPIILGETIILNTDENKIIPALIISQSNHI